MNDSQNVGTRVHNVIGKSAIRLRAISAITILVSLTAISAVAAAQTTDSTTPPADTTTTTEVTTTEAGTGDASSAETTTTTTTTTTDDGASTTTTTSDAQALGDGSSTTTTTTTTTDGATTTDTTAVSGNADEAAEEIQAEREPLAWRNSYFNYSVAANFCAFARDCQLSYDPTVYTWISLSPRWYLDPSTFFSFYQPFYVEHTDDDSATYQHEFQVLDTRISLNHRFALGNNFLVILGGSAWIPSSKGSQAAQRYFRLGGSLSATWDPGVGGFNLSAQTGYLHWFAGSNVPLTSAPYAAWTPTGGGPDSVSNQASGSTSEVDRVTTGITAN